MVGGTGVGVVSLVVVIGGRLLALIVDRGHGLGFVVGAYTYLWQFNFEITFLC